MSFRLRLLGLLTLVAITATGATAWLSLRQASRQISDSASVDQAQLDTITKQLNEYGRQHATWIGVANLVAELKGRTGQRLHLRTESGEVLVDTDTLEHRTPRPLGSSTSFVDPWPVLALPAGTANPDRVVLERIRAYRADARFATCMASLDLHVRVAGVHYGIPSLEAVPSLGLKAADAGADSCRARATDAAAMEQIPLTQVNSCMDKVSPTETPVPRKDPTSGKLTSQQNSADMLYQSPPDSHRTAPDATCLAAAFINGIHDLAPEPAQLHLGARDDTARLDAGPLLAGAAGVAAIAIIGTAAVSNRVLRPVRSLTQAARRLGQGDLTARVRLSGYDELAELGWSFNRMADSLQRGEERQRHLIADVAHELRTPLANLRGYLEALADGVIQPDPELFASLHEEAVLQQRIVDDLQELALAESGNLTYHRTEVDLTELLEVCAASHQALAGPAGVTLSVEAERTTVKADPDRLRQVIGNLVTNAVRATPAGGSVTLRATERDQVAVVNVVDTGTGIAPDECPHIFDRFWRADAARGRRTGGAGLGLAIVKQIVTDHGGTIEVASELGVGTTFTITLPARATPTDLEQSGADDAR